MVLLSCFLDVHIYDGGASEVCQRSNWFVWVSYSPISNSMFRVVFTNGDDIDCDGDNLGVPEEDFCKGYSFDPYLRVYAVVVGDFEFSDYSENGPTKIIWLLLTMFGTVILLNVLIASKLQAVIVESALCLAILTYCLVPVVSLSYTLCQQSSIILFRR
jgi:hypothetical protein